MQKVLLPPPHSVGSGGGEDYCSALEFWGVRGGGWSHKGYKYQQPNFGLVPENN